MDDENVGMKLVREEAAKGGDVIGAVQRVVESALKDLDAAVAESEHDLAEADALYGEAESDGEEPGADADSGKKD